MSEANRAQIDLWDGRVGQKWAAMQVSLDAMLSHCTAEVARRAGPLAGRRVLDIGCGTGETCIAWLDAGAEVTGVDVSGPMLAVAAARTSSKARLRSGGKFLFTCWRPASENGWVTTPMGAIRDLLAPSGPSQPHAPGPFALADRDRLLGIVERAGFADIAIEPFDFPVRFATEGGVPAAVRLASQIGPSGSALAGASEDIMATATERLTAALAPHEKDGQVALGGAIWIVEAIRPN